jgi:GT2 family glycosyltransferase
MIVTPPLSIVIPSYARADLLGLCLASIQRHAPAGTEVLVVDDASRDAVISRTAERFGVRVIRLPKRSGFCVAANAGIAAARGDVVEMLNDDTEVTAGWADAALRWFADPRIGAVAPLVLQLEPGRTGNPRIDSAGDEYDLGGFARKRWHGSEWAVGSGQWTEKSSELATGHRPPATVVWGVSAAAGFYRRSALLAAGGFPPDFGAYFEDVDLSFRLRTLGFEAWFDPDSVVWHRVSASYGKKPGRRTLELQSRNEERVYWRNVRGRDRVRTFPRHAAVLAGKACRRLTEGTFTPWAVGRVRAWVGG